MVDNTHPPDPPHISNQVMTDLRKEPPFVASFREVVASSSQWFEEARKIVATSNGLRMKILVQIGI